MPKQKRSGRGIARPDGRVRMGGGPQAQPPAPSPRARSRWRFLALVAIAGAALVLALTVLRTRRAGAPLPAAPGAPAALSPLDAESQVLRTALAQRPHDAGTRRALARYLLDAHRPMEALWHFRAAQEQEPTDSADQIGAARALTQAGLPELARKELIRLAATQPGDPATHLALTEALMAMAQPKAAEQALLVVGSELARSAPAQLLLGDARAAAGDRGGAESAYRRAAALEPGDGAAWDRLGRSALAAKDWVAARKAFTAAHEREPGRAGYTYRVGLAHWELGEREMAEALWRTVAETFPGYAPAHLALGKQLRKRKEWHAAAAELVAAVRADPTSEEAHRALADVMTAMGDRASALYQIGFTYLESDQPHRALAEFQKILQVAPDRVDGPLTASLAYIQMQRLDLAAVEARQGLERHPDDARLLTRLLELYMLTHNRPEARALCEGWRKRDPNAVEPLRFLAQIARDQRQLPDARRLGEQALAKNPEDAAVCYELSRTLAAMPGAGNTRRALDLARRATERNPREAEYWRQLGVLLQVAGQPEEAAGALLHALEKDLGSVASCSLLVSIATQERRPRTARFFASLVTELEARARSDKILWRDVYAHPNDAAAHARLARFLLANGNLRRARNQLRQAAALRPGDGGVRRDLAVVERLMELKVE